MAQKSYQQYCGIAAALDVVGDRWTLLILRELSFGQQRFTDLREALRGIASNLLTERLRDLTRSGVIEQIELPAPVARTVYGLTAEGERVVPVLASLATFGLSYLEDPVEGQFRARAAVRGLLLALFDPARASGRELRMRFCLDGEDEFWLQIGEGRLFRSEPSPEPDLTFTGSAVAAVRLCRGTADEMGISSDLQVTGPAAARRDFAEFFALAAP